MTKICYLLLIKSKSHSIFKDIYNFEFIMNDFSNKNEYFYDLLEVLKYEIDFNNENCIKLIIKIY